MPGEGEEESKRVGAENSPTGAGANGAGSKIDGSGAELTGGSTPGPADRVDGPGENLTVQAGAAADGQAAGSTGGNGNAPEGAALGSALESEGAEGTEEGLRLRLGLRAGFRGELGDGEEGERRVNGEQLLDDLVAIFKLFVRLPLWAAEVLALWVVHTYAFKLRDVTSYLGVISAKSRCGKTTLLHVLTELVHRPVAAASVSSPAFFRVIDQEAPTLVIDEAEKLLRSNRVIEAMLNAGYKERTAYVWRVVSQSAREARRKQREQATEGGDRGGGAGDGSGKAVAAFSCWCPKVIARIGPLSETLADRCVVIRMRQKRTEEKCERLKKLQGERLRARCERFVRENAEAIKSGEPAVPPELNDREAERWEPLLVLADLAGGKWPRLAREAAVNLSCAMENNRAHAALLQDILMLFGKAGANRMFSRTLAAELNALNGRDWQELRENKPLTGQRLAKLLHQYGLVPRTVWIGKASAKGYFSSEVMEASKRFGVRET